MLLIWFAACCLLPRVDTCAFDIGPFCQFSESACLTRCVGPPHSVKEIKVDDEDLESGLDRGRPDLDDRAGPGASPQVPGIKKQLRSYSAAPTPNRGGMGVGGDGAIVEEKKGYPSGGGGGYGRCVIVLVKGWAFWR